MANVGSLKRLQQWQPPDINFDWRSQIYHISWNDDMTTCTIEFREIYLLMNFAIFYGLLQNKIQEQSGDTFTRWNIITQKLADMLGKTLVELKVLVPIPAAQNQNVDYKNEVSLIAAYLRFVMKYYDQRSKDMKMVAVYDVNTCQQCLPVCDKEIQQGGKKQKWVATNRKHGKNKIYINPITGENRIRKIIMTKDGKRKTTYVKIK